MVPSTGKIRLLDTPAPPSATHSQTDCGASVRKADGLGFFFMTMLMSYLEMSDLSELCCAHEMVISPSEVLTLLNR